MAKVRKLSEEARPGRVPAQTIEGNDPRLAAAVALATVEPTAANLRAAAQEYLRVGVNDRAHAYLMKSIAVAPHDAAGHDALARLWRDSGFPQLGLGDAYRAVHYAPDSAIAHNTLGTILQAIGHQKAARLQYERALKLDPLATYALVNVCYGWILEGAGRQASLACRQALSLDPDSAPARHNLALAHAIMGDVDAARRTFDAADDGARAHYNMGIVHLVRREYAQAARAFEAARAASPSMRLAAERLHQIQQLVESGDEE